MHRRRLRRWLIEYPRAVPLAIFLLVAAVTALSVFAIERGENRRESAQLREAAQAIASAIERRGNAGSAYLRAGAALFATREEVPQSVFREFVNELRLDSDYRGAEGIGWARVLNPLEIAAFEESMADQAPGAYRVYPRPLFTGGRVAPVTFLLPDTERSRRALGYDMYSEQVRRAAMEEAERAVRPIASGKVVLVQEGTGEAPGFLIYMPVFEGFGENRTLRGFVYSPFNAQDFVESALELEPDSARNIRLYDEEPLEQRLLFEMGPGTSTGRSVTELVTVANRSMVLEVESARTESLTSLSMVTLIFGLLVASLLMVLARLLTQQMIEDRLSLQWLQEQNSIRDSLTRELNHRVKNSLANVLSIISLTRRRTERVEEFADGLEGRVRALSATHDLLTKSEWGTTPLRDILETELAPYAGDSGHVVEMAGPPVELAPNDALSFGLAVHELATNAAKYGALSVRDGVVSVSWGRVEEDKVRVVWQEAGGPSVETCGKSSRGFGMDLIEKIVAHEFDHPVDIDFAPGGVRCVLIVPIRRPSDFAIRMRYKKR